MPRMPRNPPWFPAAYACALLAQLALAAGLASAYWQQTGQLPLTDSSQRGVLAAGSEPAMKRPIAQLLRHRSHAILDQNRAAFLRTVDPGSRHFSATQARLFQRVIEVPFSHWDHEVRGTVAPDIRQQWLPRLQRRYGAPVWLAEVTIRYRFTAVPSFELADTHYLTFVLRDGAWYLAADDDLDPAGLRSARQLWDSGPAVAAGGDGTLVLGHRVQQDFVQQVGRATERARSAVASLFGDEIAPMVVMVPTDLDEARKLLHVDSASGTERSEPVHLSALSAVTTSAGGADSRGIYVVINTEAMARYSEQEQGIVLRHEAAHIATRQPAGAAAPSWLSEGIAEYAAYVGSGLDQAQFAPDLMSSLRSGQLPQRLPERRSFEPTAGAAADMKATGLAYRYAWSACVLLVERVGFAELLEIYRRSAGQTGGEAGSVWSPALQDRLVLSREEFVQLWWEYLVTSFAAPRG